MYCFEFQSYTTNTRLIHLLGFDVLRWYILIKQKQMIQKKPNKNASKNT